MNALIFSVSFALIAAGIFLSARLFDKRIAIALAVACAFYLGVDDFVTGLPPELHILSVLGGHWNWSGKILSLLLSAIVIVAFGLSPAAVGLTLRQRNAGIGVIALALFVIWGACLGLLFKPGAPDAETLAFQAIMPGLSEELVYRGIAPALLLGMIRQQKPSEDMPWAAIFATALVFGVWHGLQYSDGKFGFDFMSALFPLIGSIPGGWLRFKTGSLVFPILAHGIANVAFHVAGGIG